ncbi:hypothetical protein B2J93_1084 [Marssonina coronariae]|uniref:Helicase ATP-binding domain-containing protein n=1 Tax=Diplocarpon coronariae TaxID=2795749 RepID=A0A218YY00_9HELO|nr:hypothetical protein B2J93_1084 [Marssonina coronariae]
MSTSRATGKDARSILQEHARKTYQNNLFAEPWRNLPEIPSTDEIKPALRNLAFGSNDLWDAYQRETVYDHNLPKNIINGPWPSKEEYVGAHYQMLREDAIASLRKSVADVHRNPSMHDDVETWIYTHVTFTGLQLSRTGVASRVEFSTERAGPKRIRWEQSKRLVQGTLVALTPAQDMFKNVCKIATVAARPLDGGLNQNPPQIDLFWGDTDDIVLDPVEKYVMVEARGGYFEASRHMLVAMQKLMTERFSLQKYLVNLDADVENPEYILENPYLDLTSLERPVTEEAMLSQASPSLFNVNVLEKFPTDIKSGMDMSQMMACENILTKSLALVQGPPGTGKTFVSVSALEVLIRNIGPNDPPVIITAQTNHALDQLLNHVMVFEPNIVRLGGQSDKSNKEILERTLYKLRTADGNGKIAGISAGLRGAGKEHDSLCDEVKAVLSPLLSNVTLTAEKLLKYGIITDGQSKSLHDDEWAEDDEEIEADIATWLSADQLMLIPRAPLVNLGLPLEDADIELEQLRDLEASGEAHEEKESDFGLNGIWVGFQRRFTGRHSAPVHGGDVKKLLKKCENMYEIPQARRGEVYRYFEKEIDAVIATSLRQLLQKYKRCVDDYSVTKSMCSINLIKGLGIKVIGCTTTGLSKYRGLLSALQPRTLLIEEAAETLEGKIIAGLFDSLEQLILVGDHQQLQASCTIRALEEAPHSLSVSMFERLVNNSMPYVMLNKQRRMITDVRRLLCIEPRPFYTSLHDHATVLDRVHNRPPIPGMGGLDTYFFHHTWGESLSADRSRSNLMEAEMVVGFFNYLKLNGVDPGKITILTFYNGQRKLIIKTLKQHVGLRDVVYFKVFTVDSYQGEENDVILLSLVRSNNSMGIGFLDNRNRLVVALSRARRGLYLFGNAVTLTGAEGDHNFLGRDELWLPLALDMKKQGRFNLDGGSDSRRGLYSSSQMGQTSKAHEPISSRSTSDHSSLHRQVQGRGFWNSSVPYSTNRYYRQNNEPAQNPNAKAWKEWNPEKDDEMRAEEIRQNAARIPKKDHLTMVIKETYRPVTIKNGIRTADPSGTRRITIPRSEVLDTYEAAQTSRPARAALNMTPNSSDHGSQQCLTQKFSKLELGGFKDDDQVQSGKYGPQPPPAATQREQSTCNAPPATATATGLSPSTSHSSSTLGLENPIDVSRLISHSLLDDPIVFSPSAYPPPSAIRYHTASPREVSSEISAFCLPSPVLAAQHAQALDQQSRRPPMFQAHQVFPCSRPNSQMRTSRYNSPQQLSLAPRSLIDESSDISSLVLSPALSASAGNYSMTRGFSCSAAGNAGQGLGGLLPIVGDNQNHARSTYDNSSRCDASEDASDLMVFAQNSPVCRQHVPSHESPFIENGMVNLTPLQKQANEAEDLIDFT